MTPRPGPSLWLIRWPFVLLRVEVCPLCAALVPWLARSAHERWHLAAGPQ